MNELGWLEVMGRYWQKKRGRVTVEEGYVVDYQHGSAGGGWMAGHTLWKKRKRMGGWNSHGRSEMVMARSILFLRTLLELGNHYLQKKFPS